MDQVSQGKMLPVVVVIPCYKVRRHIGDVLRGLANRVEHIYVIDDSCPEQTGQFVQQTAFDLGDTGLTVLFHTVNQGVGGAVITGYRRALADGRKVVVKMDGDNQMDPAHLAALVAPLLRGDADYAKGNRFFDVYSLNAMPTIRLIGNAGLSFLLKAVTGYWDIMDPTNGYTAIHSVALSRLPLNNLDRRYFFESDILFRLATIRAVVQDIPMPAIYGDEVSNLRISRVLLDFPWRCAIRMIKRFFYRYILQDFNIGSIETIFGLIMLMFGGIFGIWHWIASIRSGQVATAGTVMIAMLPIVVGTQLLLSAINFDIANRPRLSLQRGLSARTDYAPQPNIS